MIVVDLQAVQSVGHGERGIARYTRELARALATHHPDVVDVYAYDDRLPNVERLEALGLGERLRSFRELRGMRVDVLHVNSPFERAGLADLLVPVKAEATVVTCYDLIPYRFSDHYLPTHHARAWYQSRLTMLHAADAIVTDSESAAADVADMLGIDARHITSIGAGTSPDFAPPTDSLTDRIEVLRRSIPALLPGFVLVPAGAEWRKNISGAVEAFGGLPEALRNRHQLVIASRLEGEHLDELTNQCERLGVSRQVVVTGYVDDADLVRLYQSAELVVFPSFYEGFGLPVLEARRCGARVLCSNTSSLPEVLPEPSALFNPYDIDDMSTHIEVALTDDATKAVLDAAVDPGFSWQNSADALVDVFSTLLSDAPRRRTHRRPVVGVVAPLSADLDEGTVNAFEVIGRLRDVADVRAFVPDHAAALESAKIWPHFDVEMSNIRTLPSWTGGGDIDHVVFCTGDDTTDQAVVAVASLAPGAVLSGVIPTSDNPHSPVAAHVASQAIGVFERLDELVSAMGLTLPVRGVPK